jgi:O-antigen ligase
LRCPREPSLLNVAVPLSRPNASPSDEPEPIAPSEGWLVAQAAALVVFSSWALGGASAWAQDWIFALVLLSLPLLALRHRENRQIPFWAFVPALLWLAFAIIALLNPSHTASAHDGWLPRAGWIRWLPTTVDPAHTLADARLWLAALLQGAAAAALLRNARAARWLWRVLALNGVALAAVGAAFHFAQAEQVLGAFDAPEPSYFFATFYYKNHWAAYGALAAVASLALALLAWPAALEGNPAARGQTLLFGGAGLLTLVTLPLPGSRAGALLAAVLIAGFGATVLFLWWRAKRRRHPWILLAGVALALAIVGFGVNAYLPRGRADFTRTERQFAGHNAGDALDLRLLISRDTWSMARERPWFGWGPGCFEIVFPVFHGSYLRGPEGKPLARLEYAHNDWLQQLAEDGIVGAALLLVPAVIAGWRAWRRAALAGRWALAGCALVAAYAWVDFPLHNPAVLMLWVVVLTTAHRLQPQSP